MDVHVTADAANGRGPRRVMHFSREGEEYVDTIDPFDGSARGKCLGRVAARLQVPRQQLDPLNGQIVRAAQKSDQAAKAIDYAPTTFADLADRSLETSYLVEWVLADRQPCLLAGPKKSLKTSLALDLAISLARGGRFLGKFRVPRPVRTAFMSGESGLPVLQETGLRIARAAGHDPAELANLLITERLPSIGHGDHTEALERFARDHELKVLFIDPAYLALPCENTGDLHAVGQRLRCLNELSERTGVTVVLIHHTRKNTGRNRFAPPELEDIAWAGYQEWAR